MSDYTFVQRSVRTTPSLLILLGLTLLPAAVAFIAHRTTTPKPNTTATTTARVQENYGQVPLHFEANQGQYQSAVKYLTRGKGYSIALTPQAAVIELQNERAATVEMKLKGANAAPRITSAEPLATKMNYFIGNDPKEWKTDVPTFAKVKYEQVYPGTDVVYYGNQQQLEYDFIVAPQADPSAIKLEFTGVNAMRLDDGGNLLLATDAGEVKQHKPIIYQEVAGQRREIAGSYRLDENEVGFAIGDYDRSLPLVIDPVIAYATWVNGVGDESHAIAVDAQGNAYIAGGATPGHVTTPSAINSSTSSTQAGFVYVAKLNSTGTNLVYAALIGGLTPVQDPATNRFLLGSEGYGIAVDRQGNAYVTGSQTSADFPTLAGAVQQTYTPLRDAVAAAFVIKLNSTGSRLLYSTLLGNGGGNAIAVDSAGQAVVTGFSSAATLPVKAALQDAYQGGGDAFVTKLNATGTDTIFSTYLGSASVDRGLALALDAQGNSYVTGETANGRNPNSSGQQVWGNRFPTTTGAFQTSEAETMEALYVSKFDPSGKLVYSTLIQNAEGGNAGSFTQSIAVDAAGCVYFAAAASDNNYPTTAGAYQTSKIGCPTRECGSDIVLTKLSADGSRLAYSTYYGTPSPSAVDRPGGLVIDADGNAYLAHKNGLIVKMNAQGTQVLSTITVPGCEIVGLALDAARNVYITGHATAGFPATSDAYQRKGPQSGQWAAFVAKLTETAVSPAAAYSIRGTLKLRSGAAHEGVKVMLQGTVNRTAMTDSNGGYLFDLLPAGGNYTVAPDAANYLALPGAANVNNLSAHQVLNFEVANKEARYVSHVSAANYATGPLANESIVSAFGTNLTPLTQRATEFPLPREMGGTKVRVKDSAGTEKYAELLFISPTQVNYVLPSGLALGSALVTVTSPDGTTSKEVMILETTTPGLFTADASGRGLAAANVQRVKADGTQKTEDIVTFDPIRARMVAVPIDLGAIDDKVYLTLYGTGVRHRLSLANVRATVGGVASTVSYAGSQNHFAGLDQINVLIPRELAGRGEVEVTLTVDGKPANAVRVKIK